MGGAPITISWQFVAAASSTIAAAASRPRTIRGDTRIPYESPIAAARIRTRRASASSSSMCESSGSTDGTSITATAVIDTPCSAESRQATSTAFSDSALSTTGTRIDRYPTVTMARFLRTPSTLGAPVLRPA